MNELNKTLEETGYTATAEQVVELAKAYVSNLDGGTAAAGSYLKILIAGMKSKLATSKKRPSVESDRRVLEAVTGVYYPAVLRGITTPEIAEDISVSAEESRRRSLERNRRTNFARTAKSVLDSFLRAGGDVRTLTVSEVTKSMLREYVRGNAPDTASRRAVDRYGDRFEREVTKLAHSSPAEALTYLQSAISKLQALSDDLDAKVAPVLGVHRREQQMPHQASMAA